MTIGNEATKKAYDKGRKDMNSSIREIGISASSKKFNMDNPSDVPFSSLEAYFYAKGGIDVLCGRVA